MICTHCGYNLHLSATRCPNCNQELKVTVLSPEESDHFNGITIEQDCHHQYHYDENSSQGSNPYVYVRHINLGNSKAHIFTKLIIGAVLLFMIIVALPVAMILIAFFSIIWFFIRLASPKRY